jgi:hypothetical protein
VRISQFVCFSVPTGASTGAFSGSRAAVATTGQVVFDVDGVEYDDEFDPGWVAHP